MSKALEEVSNAIDGGGMNIGADLMAFCGDCSPAELAIGLAIIEKTKANLTQHGSRTITRHSLPAPQAGRVHSPNRKLPVLHFASKLL